MDLLDDVFEQDKDKHWVELNGFQLQNETIQDAHSGVSKVKVRHASYTHANFCGGKWSVVIHTAINSDGIYLLDDAVVQIIPLNETGFAPLSVVPKRSFFSLKDKEEKPLHFYAIKDTSNVLLTFSKELIALKGEIVSLKYHAGNYHLLANQIGVKPENKRKLFEFISQLLLVQLT